MGKQTGDWAKRRAWIAFGANLPSSAGAPLETLRAAVHALQSKGSRISAISRIYETPCFPEGAGPDYINFAAEIETVLAPEELLALLHEVEHSFGRVRETRWAGRPIDLDLMAFEDEVFPDVASVSSWIELPLAQQSVRAPDRLILPHPRIQDRAFMLIPFADLAPDWRHPILGKTVAKMLAARPEAEKSEVKPLEGIEILVD
ncbi:2-amino-4-hydroxy-6-hydroxymethyldihydropteridine diphosphokinase [Celeribacter persicus]|uniref:2-amino-4-hydroxy-6-hydroxymethyldihydropteridine pyrophosphokinase n=1 Tax=Celeribacter persicus TaxID=1651082 RepID=A0A2T5HT55_9RHOB|nr:2-amino-4-hydroxy-6-hydroxymethyldihydropteridine diphosphokinase [Celeribacter persicus]PTQ74770.1 2-amino-4-hydroxy-6-hydroxymethyldihydropteridine diphosphokinase [Celeribacter persicus]